MFKDIREKLERIDVMTDMRPGITDRDFDDAVRNEVRRNLKLNPTSELLVREGNESLVIDVATAAAMQGVSAVLERTTTGPISYEERALATYLALGVVQSVTRSVFDMAAQGISTHAAIALVNIDDPDEQEKFMQRTLEKIRENTKEQATRE